MLIDLLIVLSAATYFTVAVVTLGRNRRSLSHLSFSALALCYTLWALGFIPYSNPFIFDSLFWIKYIYFIVELLVLSMFYFAYAFPNDRRPPSWAVVANLVGSTIATYLLIFTDLFVKSVSVTPEGPETKLGSAYPLVILFWTSFGIPIIYNFIRNFRNSTGSARLQFFYVLLGLTSFILTVITLDAIVPLVFGTSKYFSLSALSSLLFISLSGYAMVKHRLFDIKRALEDTFVFFLISSVTSAFFVSVATSYWIISKSAFKWDVVPFIVAAGFIFTFAFDRLDKSIRALADKHLFHSIYDYQKTLRELSQKLSTILDIHELSRTIQSTISQTLGVEKVAVLIFGEDKLLSSRAVGGFSEENIEELKESLAIKSQLNEHYQTLVVEELKRTRSESDDNRTKEHLTTLIEGMEKSTVSVLVPVTQSDKVIAILVLGDKASGDAFTVQDISLLSTVSSQAAIAIENAKLYEQLSDFNQNLQKRVDEATNELRQKNAEVEKAYQELKSLDALKDQLISITSHELNTPASVVQNYLWMVINQPDAKTKLSPVDKERLKVSFNSIHSLISLVSNILNASRIEAGRLQVDIQNVDPSMVIDEVLEELAPKADERKLKLESKDIKKLPGVAADPLRLKEIFTNLLTNAIKYTEQGGVTISAEVKEGEIEFVVSDTGRGIAPEHMPHLFEKFYREDTSLSASTPKTGGTGLGLYITKNYVEMMKGRIWVDSVQSKGSQFHFTIPLAAKKAPVGATS